MCCDSRKAVRQAAITYLQRALLAHELQDLTAHEWFACFKEVIWTHLTIHFGMPSVASCIVECSNTCR